MKQLTCEMCGSTELVKDGGFFVCQTCGTKYSVEEAKKMMIEGTVDVQGTVKVDNSAFVEKYLANARRAKQKEDWSETEKYYNMVEQNDPTNIEAIFYSSYGKAKTSLLDSDLYKRQAAFKVLRNCVSILDDNFDVEKEEENRGAIKEISSDIIGMACSEYVYNQRKNGYGLVTWTDKSETVHLFNLLGGEFITTLFKIAGKIPEEKKEKRVFYLDCVIKHAEFLINNGGFSNANKKAYYDIIMNARKNINAIDPSRELPSDSNEGKTNENVVKEKKWSTSMILGVVGIVSAWLIALAGHIVSIIGIVKGVKEYKEEGDNKGLILSAIGEVCAIISSLIGFISMM